MTARWVIPTILYVLMLGALGITTKLALRTMSWQEMLVWAAIAYGTTAAALLALGQAGLGWGSGSGWGLLCGALAVGGLIALFVALGEADASKVVPVTAAYPAVTVLLSALVLSEHISLARVVGLCLVVGGVALLTGTA